MPGGPPARFIPLRLCDCLIGIVSKCFLYRDDKDYMAWCVRACVRAACAIYTIEIVSKFFLYRDDKDCMAWCVRTTSHVCIPLQISLSLQSPFPDSRSPTDAKLKKTVPQSVF